MTSRWCPLDKLTFSSSTEKKVKSWTFKCCRLLPTITTPNWGNCRAWLLQSGPAANMTMPSRGNCRSWPMPSGTAANHDYARSRQLSSIAAAIWPCCQPRLRQVDATVDHGCCHLALLPTMATPSRGNCQAWLLPSDPAVNHDYAKSWQLKSMALPSGPVANHDNAKSRQLSNMAAAVWPWCQPWLRKVEATVEHGCCQPWLRQVEATFEHGCCQPWLRQVEATIWLAGWPYTANLNTFQGMPESVNLLARQRQLKNAIALYSIPCLLDRKCFTLGLNVSLEDKMKTILTLHVIKFVQVLHLIPLFLKQILRILPRKNQLNFVIIVFPFYTVFLDQQFCSTVGKDQCSLNTILS